MNLSQLEIGEVLGKGSYGQVLKVRHLSTNQTYAMKKIDLASMNEEDRIQTQKQIQLMKQLKTEFVVKYYGSFIEQDFLFILMQFCSNGDLAHQLYTQNRLMQEWAVWKVALQIMVGLREIHRKGIVHRDIKCSNIFVDKDQNIRIGDLGVAKEIGSGLTTTYIGTPQFMSPELLDFQPYCLKTDVWSLGCVIYELCTQNKPFRQESKVLTISYDPIPRFYSLQLCQLIRLCLSPVETRPTVDEILSRPEIMEKARQQKIRVNLDVKSALNEIPDNSYTTKDVIGLRQENSSHGTFIEGKEKINRKQELLRQYQQSQVQQHKLGSRSLRISDQQAGGRSLHMTYTINDPIKQREYAQQPNEVRLVQNKKQAELATTASDFTVKAVNPQKVLIQKTGRTLPLGHNLRMDAKWENSQRSLRLRP